jgi:hypothetical protein
LFDSPELSGEREDEVREKGARERMGQKRGANAEDVADEHQSL